MLLTGMLLHRTNKSLFRCVADFMPNLLPVPVSHVGDNSACATPAAASHTALSAGVASGLTFRCRGRLPVSLRR